MRYTLLLHYAEMTPADLGPEAIAEGMREFDDYAKALDAAGVLISAEVLQPSRVTTTVASARWHAARPGRPVRRHEGAARRHVRARRRRPGCRARVGREGAVGRVGRGRDPARRRRSSSTARGPRRVPMTAAGDVRARRRAAARASYGRLLALLAAATRRHRARRGRPRRRLRAGTAQVAGRRHPREPRRVAAHRGPQPAARRARSARRAHERPARRRVAATPATIRVDDALDPRCDPRQAPRAAVRLRAPGDRPGHPHPADAAGRARLRCRADRAAFAVDRDDGAAARAGEAPHPRRRHPVRGADARRHARRGCRRCSRRSTARTRSTGWIGRRACASRSPTRRAGSRCSRRAARRRAGGVRAGGADHVSQSRAPRARCGAVAAARQAGPGLWDAALIAEGEALLRRASALGAAARAIPARGGDPVGALRSGPHRRAGLRALVRLYRGLVAIAPTAGARPRWLRRRRGSRG